MKEAPSGTMDPMRASLLTFLLAAALALPAAALAHGEGGRATGFTSTVERVTPETQGLELRVLDGDDRLFLRNETGREVIVLGYDEEPYLRFVDGAVYRNVRSPAVYLNADRYALGEVPESADPDAAPVWRRVAEGTAYEWHDHRIQWMSTIAPDEVRADPDSARHVFDWVRADRRGRRARDDRGLPGLRAGRRGPDRVGLSGRLASDGCGSARLGAPSRPPPAGGSRLVKQAAALALLLAALLAAGCGGDAEEDAGNEVASVSTVEDDDGWAGAALGNPGVVPDFVLTDHERKRVRISDQRGKIVLLTFLYTQCPDICPLMADNLNAALLQLDPATRDDVRVLAVSVDPERDTPATVRGYVKVHRLVPEFRYLIGSKRELTEVWEKYEVQAAARDPELIDHTAYTLLIDRDGRGLVLYPSDFTSSEILTDLRRVLES